MQNPTWHYHAVLVSCDHNDYALLVSQVNYKERQPKQSLDDFLNGFGHEGWELAGQSSVAPNGVLYTFKRRSSQTD